MSTNDATPTPTSGYVLKGFASHSQFVNNNPGIVNPIGELSQLGETYSREIGLYYSTNATNITLNAFCTKNQGTFQIPDVNLKERVIAVSNWVYNNTITTSGQLYADQIMMALINAYPGTINNMRSGAMVTDGTHWVPGWLSWYDTPTNAFVRIWFADDSFRHTYDEFEIVIGAPLDNLDDFFKLGADVVTELRAITPTQAALKMMKVRGSSPETYYRMDEFDYHDPLNPARIEPTNWIILVYGEAGNNIDSIKDALVAFILSNSTHGQADWIQVLPDIFRRTEFMIVPNWANYAIPEKVTQAGIGSPISKITDMVALINQYAPSYDAYHRANFATTFAYPYKSLTMAAISSEQNRDGKFLLTDYFPDYIDVSSTSQDFNRMSESTRGWSEMISNMLLAAETMDRYSDVPLNMTRLFRDNTLYLVSSYDNVHYLVVAKFNTLPQS